MSIYAAVAGQLYGSAWGGKIISIFIGSFGLAGIVIGGVQEVCIAEFGYLNLFIFLALCSAIGGAIVLFGYKSDNKWTRMKIENEAVSESLLD